MVMCDAWQELNQHGSGENHAPEKDEPCCCNCGCNTAEEAKEDKSCATAVVVELTRETLEKMDEEDLTGLCKQIFKDIKEKTKHE